MTISLYLQCIAMCFFGQAVHLFIIKIPALKERSRVANKSFSMRDWWACDWNLVIGTFAIMAILLIGLDELTKWQPVILNKVKWLFAFVGAFGSTVAMSKWSAFEKGINNVVDMKTNIADEVIKKDQV
jgi:hypothetical protein